MWWQLSKVAYYDGASLRIQLSLHCRVWFVMALLMMVVPAKKCKEFLSKSMKSYTVQQPRASSSHNIELVHWQLHWQSLSSTRRGRYHHQHRHIVSPTLFLNSDSPALTSCILMFISSHQGLLCPMWVYSLPRSYWRRPFTHSCCSKLSVEILLQLVCAYSAIRKCVYDQDSRLHIHKIGTAIQGRNAFWHEWFDRNQIISWCLCWKDRKSKMQHIK